MKYYSGPYFSEDGFIQAEVLVDKGEVKDFEEGGDRGEKVMIIPSLCNSHTHIGDSVVSEPPVGSIEEVVGPGGIKHRELSEASEEEMILSMIGYINRSESNGIKHIIEFRENGLKGLSKLKIADERSKGSIDLNVMGRPSEKRYDRQELNKIISNASGLGLSAYRDWDEAELKKIADHVKNGSTSLAMHCSEDVREPIEKVLELDVHHLVHMIEADEEDLKECADDEVPVVICPRSNMFFGKIPDIPKMLKAGITLSLGTDNAMISGPNIFREMETAYRIGMMQGGIEPEEILMMATWNPRRSLLGSRKWRQRDSLMLLEHDEKDPAHEVVSVTTPNDILRFVEIIR